MMNFNENNLIVEEPSLEKSLSLEERIQQLKTDDIMKKDIILVWRGQTRVADIVIAPDDTDEEEVNWEVRRNKIMADTENLLKDLGLYYLRQPNNFSAGFGKEEFIIGKSPKDLELFRKNKEIIYDDSNYDTSKEQAIVAGLLGKNFGNNQQMRKAA